MSWFVLLISARALLRAGVLIAGQELDTSKAIAGAVINIVLASWGLWLLIGDKL